MADRRDNRRPERKDRKDRRERPERNERRERFEPEERNDIIAGRNPVIEALKAGREMERIVVADGSEGSISKIVGMAREKGIVVQFRERAYLDKLARNHQGVLAFVSAYSYAELDDIFKKAEEAGEDPFIMILDDLEDPHNLGAIMRTCECAGAHGVIVPKRRAAGLTETVVKASAGAIEYVPCVRVTNIAQTIDELKQKGVWIAACDMGGNEYYRQDMTGSLGIVIGSEGKGISRLVKEKCDFTVSMPMVGKITSLNASNAAAVIMYEVRRQRDARKI